MMKTGVKDSEGVEISVGDILYSSGELSQVFFGLWTVHDVYDCGETEVIGFYLKSICERNDGSSFISYSTIVDAGFGEILGNVHDNPELLDKFNDS